MKFQTFSLSLPTKKNVRRFFILFYLKKKKEMTTEERKVNSHFHDEEKGHQIKKCWVIKF
jgi:hypothetical protein